MTVNIINAIYVHFWWPRIKKEILWNMVPEKYSDAELDKLGQSY